MTKKITTEEAMSDHECALALGASQLKDGTYQRGDFIFPTADDFLQEMVARDNDPIQQSLEIELLAAMAYPYIHSPHPGTSKENHVASSRIARNIARNIIYKKKST